MEVVVECKKAEGVRGEVEPAVVKARQVMANNCVRSIACLQQVRVDGS